MQVLPELNAGGVERGTVEFANYLVAKGHRSIVISHGGSQVALLEQQGSEHIHFPVHKKSLLSLRHVRRLRCLLKQLEADIIHVRSRLPAWLVWLAIGKQPRSTRPALVSTFHGLYSINRYSEIMGCGDQVIAISQCVADYIANNYPRIAQQKVSIVPRGVDVAVFNSHHQPSRQWCDDFFSQYPQLVGQRLILLPGRLSAWKGHEQFMTMIKALKQRGVACHGLIVGGPTPGKEQYQQALKDKVLAENLGEDITFTGHRSDIENIYTLSSIVCNLSQHPEPFGRTVIEALAMKIPVLAFNVGGPAESLQDCLPQGLVPVNDTSAAVAVIEQFLQTTPSITLPDAYTLAAQAEKTLAIYRQAIDTNTIVKN